MKARNIYFIFFFFVNFAKIRLMDWTSKEMIWQIDKLYGITYNTHMKNTTFEIAWSALHWRIGFPDLHHRSHSTICCSIPVIDLITWSDYFDPRGKVNFESEMIHLCSLILIDLETIWNFRTLEKGSDITNFDICFLLFYSRCDKRNSVALRKEEIGELTNSFPLDSCL